MNAETTAKLLGITDDSSVCECCGKTNLKRVAVLELADGSIVRFGRDCAAKKLGKSFGVNIDSLVEIKNYIAKWETKYTADIVVKGIQNKLGYSAQYKDGKYIIHGVGII